MSNTRVIVTEEAGVFRLRTERGFVLGPRLYSANPEDGKVLPGLQDEFPNKLAATRAAMDWNVYLLYAWQKTLKKTREIRRLTKNNFSRIILLLLFLTLC